MNDELVFNEFAAVACRHDHQGNGVRLRLEDVRSGRVCYLDALQLETLIWLPPAWWDRLLDPSIRWSDDFAGTDDVDG
jgi:hypothetical protein